MCKSVSIFSSFSVFIVPNIFRLIYISCLLYIIDAKGINQKQNKVSFLLESPTEFEKYQQPFRMM